MSLEGLGLEEIRVVVLWRSWAMWRHAVRPLRSGLNAAARQPWGSQERVISGTGGRRQRWVALWGNGDYGRLGQASGESVWVPKPCVRMQHLQPVAVACGGAHTLVLTGLASHLSETLSSFSLCMAISMEPDLRVGLWEVCPRGLRFGAFILIKEAIRR